ncbi:MAG: hypothetical protein TR69_WS6001000709 [candidate division WS6 bacterium OLB20]|uniref:Uncharacterized protein n=1 Tax=candidate division WS6 bacterium OLB20 TaxID=1617426 RepID=A0A136LYM9_9BACT|nr:MAG: hypothetical protein TR69_WS6001000709 [candidate division WS6 bacterium OLB20]
MSTTPGETGPVQLFIEFTSRVSNQSPPLELSEQVTQLQSWFDETGIRPTQEMLEEAYDTARAYHEEYIPHPRRANHLAHTLFAACATAVGVVFNAPEP